MTDQLSEQLVIDRPVLLYDGVCGFCNRAVQFLLRIDRHAALRYSALEGAFAAGVIDRHPDLAYIDSVVLVEHPGTPRETIAVRSDAALRALAHVGGVWRATGVLRLVPSFVRDRAYDGFAAVRYRIFGRLEACPVPSPEVRARFLD